MSKVIFSFTGIETTIQCLNSDKMRDICNRFSEKIKIDINTIYFIYGSDRLNLESTFEQQANGIDKERNIMNILVYEKEKTTVVNDGIVKSRDIICPKCGENCLIKFNNFKIKLSECKNGHQIDNLFLDEFDKTQNINLNNIICNNCNKNKNKAYNKQFFRCLTCKQNICPLCSSKHDKKHRIIDYDNINYTCDIHNDNYFFYCNECKTNLCIKCKTKHDKNHEIISYENIYPNEDEIKEELNEFKIKIDKLNQDINVIIEMLNAVKIGMDKYYKINCDLIKNELKMNYHILKNLECIKYNIKINDNDIDEILNENNIFNKIKNIMNIYNKMKNRLECINSNDNNINFINENDNEIILRYNNEHIKDNKIKIFGKNFVNNNKNKCKILCNNKIYELNEYFDISNYSNKNNILEIKLQGINNITDASYMFHECNSLSSLSDLSKWDVSIVTNMSHMFYECQLLYLPDISNWNVINVTNMNSMFGWCYKLKSLPDISNWNINNVKDISSIFCCCFDLSSLPDISKWDINNINSMFQMFSNCRSLKSLPNISNWNTSNVINMGNMFNGCTLLASLPNISNWKTNNVQSMECMFQDCYSLSSLPDISKWNIDKVCNMENICKECKDTLNIPEKFKIIKKSIEY